VRLAAAALIGLTLVGCGEGPAADEAAARGRTVYLAQCTACHATDPAQPGPLGPPIKGSPRELLEAKVLHGTYPAGYTPKRTSTVMPPMPQLASSLPDLAAFLGSR
jgi:mono/diheme cytochrome c family protein